MFIVLISCKLCPTAHLLEYFGIIVGSFNTGTENFLYIFLFFLFLANLQSTLQIEQ
jgi:hypothetical protein